MIGLILAGNTAFPVFLRFFMYVCISLSLIAHDRFIYWQMDSIEMRAQALADVCNAQLHTGSSEAVLSLWVSPVRPPLTR